MDEDATWYGCRPRPRPHCVRQGPSSPLPSKKGHSSPPSFWPMSIVAMVAHLIYCWAHVESVEKRYCFMTCTNGTMVGYQWHLMLHWSRRTGNITSQCEVAALWRLADNIKSRQATRCVYAPTFLITASDCILVLLMDMRLLIILFWGKESWPADDDCRPCSGLSTSQNSRN